MSDRLITPSQLALFSRSPVIGTWWEELKGQGLFDQQRPATTPLDELLFKQGHKHEEVLLKRLESDGKDVYRQQPVDPEGPPQEKDYANTRAAMQQGRQYIHQAALKNDEIRGWADLLERIERPSKLGDWSYIPIECKLSSHSKPIYLVQACAYCELLEPILGERPEHFKLYLGGRRFEQGEHGYPTARFWSWYELLRKRYRDFRAGFDPKQEPEDAPGDHGLWKPFIEQRLKDKRDLKLVANLRGSQRQKLRAAGITTIDALAALPEAADLDGAIDRPVLARLRDQARLQIASEQRSDGRPEYEVRPMEQQSRGLAMLPAPDDGDIWFDMEGFPDPINGEKLEYLFGACYRNPAGEVQFQGWWAHSLAEEKQAFHNFVDWVEARRVEHPDLHIYHYASYEKTALGSLASRHQIHQALIDQWLRQEVLVDLLPIVRNGLLVGAESYSIKKVERLYGPPREEEVENAAESVVQYAEWRKSKDQKILDDLLAYNKKDCEVTEGLHRFLIGLPQRAQINYRPNKWGAAAQQEGEDAQTKAYEKDLEVAARELLAELGDPAPAPKQKGQKRPLLVDENPEEVGPRGLSRRVHRLVGQLIDFHEREGKVEWWEFFHRLQMPQGERQDDSEVIAGARLDGVEGIKRSFGFHYRFDTSQPLKLAAREGRSLQFAVVPLMSDGKGLHPLEHLALADGKSWTAEGLLEEDKPDLVTIKATGDALAKAVNLSGLALPERADLILKPKLIYRNMLKELVRLAQGWVFKHQPLPPALLHLLERRAIPELVSLNQRIRKAPGTEAVELTAFLQQADGMGLSLQGPPGTGKTTVIAELIAALVCSGQRVAVSSNGNAAINHVLSKVQGCLDQRGSDALVVKASSGSSHSSDQKALADSRAQALKEADLPEAPAVLGGTVFTLVKEAYDGAPFDLLVIDEAGQMSLCNLLYMSRVARNILLVGDQQQLSQPSRADHPGESGLSCLDYVMQDHDVVPHDRGVFLATSWRMPPPLTQVVSGLFYEGQLQASAANSANTVTWQGPSQGLLFQAVEHSVNSTGSDEEVEHIAALVEQLYGRLYQLASGERGTLSREQILITAPYNVQVNRLQRRLGAKARIGTVDKFQGQEAPVAIHSLTASDAESAPRGLDFLLSPNRLNVAISRAQCLSIVVGSPQLATGISNSIANVEKLSRLCTLMLSSQGQEG